MLVIRIWLGPCEEGAGGAPQSPEISLIITIQATTSSQYARPRHRAFELRAVSARRSYSDAIKQETDTT